VGGGALLATPENAKTQQLGSSSLTGSYCIKEGTKYVDDTTCGSVQGWWGPQCEGYSG